MAKAEVKEMVTAVTPVLCNGESYAPGEQFELPESQAVALATCGAVTRAPAAPKPAAKAPKA